VYLSQTGRNFKIKFKEHVNDIIGYITEKNPDIRNTYLPPAMKEPEMLIVLKVIEIQSKGQYLNTLERYYTYKHKTMGEIFNELQYDTHNPILELI
jgi:hypothetical protein